MDDCKNLLVVSLPSPCFSLCHRANLLKHKSVNPLSTPSRAAHLSWSEVVSLSRPTGPMECAQLWGLTAFKCPKSSEINLGT